MKNFLPSLFKYFCVLLLMYLNFNLTAQNAESSASFQDFSKQIMKKTWYVSHGYKYDNRTNELKPTGTQWTRYVFKENNVLEYCYKVRRTMEQTEPEVECNNLYYEIEGNNVVTICDDASKSYCRKFQIIPKAGVELFFRQIEKDVQWLELYFTSKDLDVDNNAK